MVRMHFEALLSARVSYGTQNITCLRKYLALGFQLCQSSSLNFFQVLLYCISLVLGGESKDANKDGKGHSGPGMKSSTMFLH